MSGSMVAERHPDTARQIANLLGAALQIGAAPLGAALAGVDVGRISDENRTLVTPAGYAFAIWGPIFALSLGYAVYQALPAQRQNPLLRRIGWWTAGTFVCSGVWELVFPFRRYLAAQGLIVGGLAAVAVAYRRFAAGPRGGGPAERWLVAPTVGLYGGWLTAATAASIATTLVASDVLAGDRPEAALGAALLIATGLAAAALVEQGKPAPPAAWLSYGGAVLWALAAIVVAQRQASRLTSGAAVAAAVPVAAALLGRLPAAGTGRQAPAA